LIDAMRITPKTFKIDLVLAFVVALSAACASSKVDKGGDDGLSDGSIDNIYAGGNDSSMIQPGDDGGGIVAGDDGGGTGYVVAGDLGIAPHAATINVNYGAQTPTLTFVASVNGQTVAATFTTDQGQIANIDSVSGILTPTGMVGGTVNVQATYQNLTATVPLIVNVLYTENGASTTQTGGVGGAGGVGGEGPGGAVDAPTQAVLNGAPTTDPGVAWLYPYDKTVWPKGLLAPLLQWSAPSGHNYDAVFIDLKEAAFEYKGYFAKTATPFIHHPVPQDAWDALGYSNRGEPVVVTLVFASSGQAYGPITETWTIAQGTLKGTVYYQSYGTALLANYCCDINGNAYGAATLAIRNRATSPSVTAGDNTHCRVCHSVSADGSTLVTQENNPNPTPNAYYAYSQSDYVNLKNKNAVTPMIPDTGLSDGRYEFPALYPDGTFLFSNGAPTNGMEFTGDSQLFSVPSGTPLASTGIPAGLQAGSPVFSPDGTHVAFNYWSGPTADQKSLAAMDFDVTSHTFSNLSVLFTPPGSEPNGYWQMADWPSFLPTNDAVVFEYQLVDDANNDWGETRPSVANPTIKAQGELWWVDLATKTPTRLDNLNGHGYLPTMASTNHTDDTVLNFEPTVNVIPSGGYAWVVFTSRRMYGNVATIDPYASDPRVTDLSKNPTTKKIWVAAFDLNAAPGTDPSHPAFYLPGQELLAGNSRGYWVVDPCEPTGTTCLTGDECCGGYCRNVDGGSVCADAPAVCSNEFDKCTVAADCCALNGGLACIDGRCEVSSPTKVK